MKDNNDNNENGKIKVLPGGKKENKKESEMKIPIDELKRDLDYHIHTIEMVSKMYGARFKALMKNGFTRDEAMDIIIERGLE